MIIGSISILILIVLFSLFLIVGYFIYLYRKGHRHAWGITKMRRDIFIFLILNLRGMLKKFKNVLVHEFEQNKKRPPKR